MKKQSNQSVRFSMLYNEHRDDVYAYFRRRVGSDAAQDCAAETFLVTWKRIGDVPEGDRARLWLYGVARKVLMRRYRVGTRQRRVVKAASTAPAEFRPSTEAIVEGRFEDAELHAALGRLRPADRDVLLMAAWEELPHSEIGEIVGCSRHAVDQRVHRALKRLRAALDTAHHARAREVARRRFEKGGTG